MGVFFLPIPFLAEYNLLLLECTCESSSRTACAFLRGPPPPGLCQGLCRSSTFPCFTAHISIFLSSFPSLFLIVKKSLSSPLKAPRGVMYYGLRLILPPPRLLFYKRIICFPNHPKKIFYVNIISSHKNVLCAQEIKEAFFSMNAQTFFPHD